MSTLGLAFVLLAAASTAGMVGLWQIVKGRAERDAIAGRAQGYAAATRIDLLARLDSRLRRGSLGRALSTRLTTAGLEIRPIDFVLAVTAIALVVFALSSLLVVPVFALLLGGLSVRLSLAWLERKRQARREEMIGQLPELARTLANAVSAGLSTPAALELAARELSPPLSEELSRVVSEAQIGQSLSDALEDMRERIPSRELGVLVSTIVIQQRAGGDSVRALQDMSHTLDARNDLIREIRTVMAGSVFSGWVVVGLGIVALMLFNVLQPGLLREMTSSALGLIALIFTGGVYALGLLLIRRITRVEI